MSVLHIVIVEDETVTARNLAYLLRNVDPNINIEATLSSIGEAAKWFNSNRKVYDLVFMDIRLADGLSFDIFKQAPINKPVIFVTAYNDYAIQAFKNNGIDYILKPFDTKELEQSLNKFKLLTASQTEITPLPLALLMEHLGNITKSYKKSFLVHYRDKLLPIEAVKICWFYTANEIVYSHMPDDRQYVMEFTMEQLEQQLDPQVFFRANRQFIINRATITEVDFYFNGRLSVKVKPEPPERVLISKARAPEFKLWMNS